MLSSLTLCNNNELFFDSIVTCDKKWILHDNWRWPAQWLYWEAPNSSQSQTYTQKNVMITVWWSAAALIHYCFLNPSETIIDVYSANLWNSLQTESPTASTDQHKGPSSSPWQHPTTCCTTNDSKLNKLGCEIWLHMCYSLDLLSMNYHFFKHLDKFLRGKCFHNQQEEENAFQEFIEFWSMDFYLTGINKLISPWQKCVDCNGSYLINEDVFEPSYNDLKFMVPNHNYICTNIM